jgi:ketosteroid isomerase-like protein
MSQENVKVVRQIVDAFNRRDLADTTRHFDPEIEWTPGGPAAVERSVYRGLREVSQALAAGWEAWELFELEEREIRDLSDSALWLGRAQLRGGTSQVEVDQEFAVHFLLAEGRVTRMHGYVSWREAFEAVGLSE